MDAVIYLYFLLPVALCQNRSEVPEQCSTDSCISKAFNLFQKKIEKDLTAMKSQLRACREQETTEVTGLYAALHLNNYTAVGNVSVEDYATRLRAQGTELWCTTTTSMQAYTYDLKMLRNVTLEGVRDAYAVTPLSSRQWVAADLSGGLHVLHANGTRVKSLRKKGVFGDVVSLQGSIYALESQASGNSIVYNYRIINGKLQASSNITLPHLAQRMSVFNDTVYISDTFTNRLYHYTLSGKLLGRYGQGGVDVRGTSQPGQVYAPLLCSSDKDGNVLVADQLNYRLQVWSPKYGWKVIPLAKHSGSPIDAVVSGDTSTMWVLEEKGGNLYIVKYTK